MDRERQDSELITAFRAGDTEAFRRLYHRHAGPVLRFLRFLCGDDATANDLLQTTFLRILPALRDGRVRELGGYAHTVARHVYLRWRAEEAARRQREQIAAPRVAAVSTRPDDAASPLRRALARLPDEQRDIVVLHIDGGMTFEQVGKALRISAKTAASRYYLAVEKLKHWLRPMNDAGGQNDDTP